jgi:hypothetical protein
MMATAGSVQRQVYGVLKYLQQGKKKLIDAPLVFFCLGALAVDKPSINNSHPQDRVIGSVTPIVHLELVLHLQSSLAIRIDPAASLEIDLCC